MDAAQPQRDDLQREAVILLPTATPSNLLAVEPSPGLPAQRAASIPPTVPLPEAVPTVTVGSRAEVVFGRDEHIARSRVRSRTRRSRGYGEPLKRRLPVSEREIPAFTESEATGAEEQSHQVTMLSLWDLLVAPTSASSATTPLLFPRSSDQRRAPHQSPLWE